ncbi:MAG: JmjC domain-containing histone demethylation protein 1 [Alyxoria varia]|nr:MAG: JmjC domain-containing histone demethylation protein 1 [Alyxoria varia]
MSDARSRSFKPAFSLRPPGYRTPSPPLKDVEPISPLGDRRKVFDGYRVKKRKLEDGDAALFKTSDMSYHDSGNNPGTRHVKSTQRPPDPINTAARSRRASGLDTLAEVATSPDYNAGRFDMGFRLPTSATFPHPLTDSSQIPQSSVQRHSKRSHSEVFGSRPDILPSSRPATSHIPSIQGSVHGRSSSANFPAPASNEYPEYQNNQSPQPNQQDSDSRFEIAELLLNLSRGQPSLSKSRAAGTKAKDGILASASAELNGYHVPRETQQDRLEPKLEPQTIANIENDDYEVNEGGLHSTSDAAAQTENQSAGADMRPHSSKSREHRGWPKGKARGPRANQVESKQRTKSAPKNSELLPPHRVGSKSRQRKPSSIAHRNTFDHIDSALEQRRLRRTSDPEIVLKEHIDRPHTDKVTMRPPSLPPMLPPDPPKKKSKSAKTSENNLNDFCSACHKKRNSTNNYNESWICCNGCKTWLHASCAGFESERKMKEVDKFYCNMCQAKHGPTTFVRKSSRAHTSVDYAGLHEGKLRTSVDVAEHHYIAPIKSGTLPTQPETFPRMRPELVTEEFFYRSGGWTEPILIPAELNPRPTRPGAANNPIQLSATHESQQSSSHETESSADFHEDLEYDCVPNEGQDLLDMVMPQDMTVRQVAELYGPNEKVEVIDVKIQEGSEKPWNLRQWADYYEASGEKPVRNVISLEVSTSKLGKLIRRPKVVRELDLQDSVWPPEEAAKGNYPAVQFYCLMSVADCYTDFHIDFGGSSVYYHILKGRKTFFFIPPKAKNLKKYEEWCRSPDQSSNFLGSICGECYRVDLYPGDTMLIPSGWIHAVWTPENSLVIGGNFLTRLHYAMQIQINDIEKATGVARKFRYPYFQKVLWLTVIKYLEEDPVPLSVVEKLCRGETFPRSEPVYDEFELSDTEDPELFNSKLYPQGEVDGLPSLRSYIHRTVMISIGKVAGITKGVQDAVIRSIPKFQGSPAEALQAFAMWTAWKRGNEVLPDWALPEVAKYEFEPSTEKRPTLAALRQMERQSLYEAQNQKASRRSQRNSGKDIVNKLADEPMVDGRLGTPGTKAKASTESSANVYEESDIPYAPKDEKLENLSALEHWGVLKEPKFPPQRDESNLSYSAAVHSGTESSTNHNRTSTFTGVVINRKGTPQNAIILSKPEPPPPGASEMNSHPDSVMGNSESTASGDGRLGSGSSGADQSTPTTTTSLGKRSKARACAECRKTKRRCIHDDKGHIDPVKASERPVPRGSIAAAKRARNSMDQNQPEFKRAKHDTDGAESHLSPEPQMNGPVEGDHKEASPNPQHKNGLELSHDIHDHQSGLRDVDPDLNDTTNAQNHQVAYPHGGDTSQQIHSRVNIEDDNPSFQLSTTAIMVGNQPQQFGPPPVEPNSPKQVGLPNGTSGTPSSLSFDAHMLTEQLPDGRMGTPPPKAGLDSAERCGVSNYPPTSRLTELKPSSPITSAVPQTNGANMNDTGEGCVDTNMPNRHLSRNREQVERCGDAKTSSSDVSTGPRQAYLWKTPSKSARSRSGTSRSASRDLNQITNGAASPTPSSTSKKGASNVGKSTSINSAGKSGSPSEDDESLRLAHVLAAGEFGLRRRG